MNKLMLSGLLNTLLTVPAQEAGEDVIVAITAPTPAPSALPTDVPVEIPVEIPVDIPVAVTEVEPAVTPAIEQIAEAEAGGLFGNVWMIVAVALAVILAAVLIAVYLKGKKKKNNSVSQIGTTQMSGSGAPAKKVSVMSVDIGNAYGQGAREYQQDSFYITGTEGMENRGMLAVVADGMGGLQNGDVVSKAAVRAMVGGFMEAPVYDMEATMWDLLKICNTGVNEVLGADNLKQSGSTLIAGLLRGDKFIWSSIGDSYIFLYRNGMLTKLNRHHVLLHELQLKAVNGMGTLQEAYSHPKMSGLTSYLGRGELKYIDMPSEPIDVRPDDVILLMSDGVYNAMTKEEMISCLNGTAQDMADNLNKIVEDKAHPHQDNYTAVILKLGAPEGGV